ncbi:hypothetical protein JCM19298_2818 [Nonlabens ulvanivorans]|nr:hypothetical protein JCM19298_2818 [Nonlabens ulvanivorans]
MIRFRESVMTTTIKNTTIMITINNLSKQYNGTKVLDIESLEIPKGQAIGW